MEPHAFAGAVDAAGPATGAASAALRRQEEALGTAFPAALRAWYGREHSVAALEAPGLPAPRGVEELGTPLRWEGMEVPQLERGLLVLAGERRVASHHVAVWLDGSDDPPVLRERGSMPEHAFMIIGAVFSEWIGYRHQVRRAAQTCSAVADGEGPVALQVLPELAETLGLSVIDHDGAHERTFIAAAPGGGPTLRFREDMNRHVSWRVMAPDDATLDGVLRRAAARGLPSPRKRATRSLWTAPR